MQLKRTASPVREYKHHWNNFYAVLLEFSQLTKMFQTFK